jgi:hypothetical protein
LNALPNPRNCERSVVRLRLPGWATPGTLFTGGVCGGFLVFTPHHVQSATIQPRTNSNRWPRVGRSAGSSSSFATKALMAASSPCVKERALGIGAAPPSQKIGMSGESVDGVNAGAHPDRLARNRDFIGALDDLARERALPSAKRLAEIVPPAPHWVSAGLTPPTVRPFRQRSSASQSLAPASRHSLAQPGVVISLRCWRLEASRRSPSG